MTALLRFENVALRRGGRLLFENLDLDLAPGEALQVAGPNGTREIAFADFPAIVGNA